MAALNSKNDSYLLNTDEVGIYTLKGDTLTFGPGLAEHKGVQLRGALPHMSSPTVYLTGFTPFKHTIRIS
ncbi:hypothetical protein V8V91_10015 [Algoriphagus halophilus]|uniref:hypothetical protein n=1 Tax=Algoriphagus halophilus TaxID=226505 RepID=UPI00358ECCD0